MFISVKGAIFTAMSKVEDIEASAKRNPTSSLLSGPQQTAPGLWPLDGLDPCPDTGCRDQLVSPSGGGKVITVSHPRTYLCDFKWNAIAQDFLVEALLGHVAGEPVGSLEGIFQPLQFHIGDCKKAGIKNT